jgi:serine/threonine protein kinase
MRAKNVLLASVDEEGDDMLPITKLADFGTVRVDVRHRKFSSQATSEHNMESHGVTKQIIGTRPYMSYGIVNTQYCNMV